MRNWTSFLLVESTTEGSTERRLFDECYISESPPQKSPPTEETYLSLVHFVTNDILIIAYFVQQQATIHNTRKRCFLWYFFVLVATILYTNYPKSASWLILDLQTESNLRLVLQVWHACVLSALPALVRTAGETNRRRQSPWTACRKN